MKIVNMFLIITLLVLVAWTNASTNVNSCGDTSKGFVPDATVSNPQGECVDPPCIVQPGADLILSMTFTSPRYLENMKPQAVAVAEGITLTYPLFQDDACVGITNTQCPIVKNEKIPASITFSLIDKDLNEDIICFELDIQVKKA